jgi:hypothetical protein
VATRLRGFYSLIEGLCVRRRHPTYEIFYAVHHLLFILYIVTVARLIICNRRHRTRHQTFHWYQQLSYLCDRAATPIITTRQSSSCLLPPREGIQNGGPELRRPTSLTRAWPVRFYPSPFHPFGTLSISRQDQTHLPKFFIEVFDERSWTGKLWWLSTKSS